MPYATGRYYLANFGADGSAIGSPLPFHWNAPVLGHFQLLAKATFRNFWQWTKDGLSPHPSRHPVPEIVVVYNEAGDEVCQWSKCDELEIDHCR